MPERKLRTPAQYLVKTVAMRDIVINIHNVGHPSVVQESSKRFSAPTPSYTTNPAVFSGWFKTQGRKHFLIATFRSDRKAEQY